MVRKQSERWQDSIKPANSNTRIFVAGAGSNLARQSTKTLVASDPDNLGLTSERLRQTMVQRVREQGVHHEAVLAAMAKVPRHRFVDQALASRAYEDGALPIGHGQTISQPWVVARMLAALCEPDIPAKVLEVGTGCGYQAAVMAGVFNRVYTIERVRPLYDMATKRLSGLGIRNVHGLFGDGMLGWKVQAPFDAIVVAAAGLTIPQTLLDQLAVGGKLIAPEGVKVQKLVQVTRESANRWVRLELETVRFVPLIPGIQT